MMPAEKKRRLLELRSQRRLYLSRTQSSVLHDASSEFNKNLTQTRNPFPAINSETISNLSPSLVSVCQVRLPLIPCPLQVVMCQRLLPMLFPMHNQLLVLYIQPLLAQHVFSTIKDVGKRIMLWQSRKKKMKGHKQKRLLSSISPHQPVPLASFNPQITELTTFSLSRRSSGSGGTSTMPFQTDVPGPSQEMVSLCVETHMVHSFSICHTSAWILPLVPKCRFCDPFDFSVNRQVFVVEKGRF